jgi:exodeoxyribonuclease I
MAASFFFYDLETSGFSSREARIMQFAGQRTDMELQPIGEPVNALIKLTPDVLPDPDAVLLTGITPQQTLSEGVSEAEFLQLFQDKVVQPDTIFLGYNSIRFDDEFMRFLQYRNFQDPYEWQWVNGSSRWDLLDVARMTRALRPDGIEWPFASDGRPTNRLELLTKLNKLDHAHAHDALNDVLATIALARLIRSKHPELFDYLLKTRGKKAVGELVLKGTPFVYTSGNYPSTVQHTTAAVLLAKHPQTDTALVYDLRHDPTPFVDLDVDTLVKYWKFTRDPDQPRLPVKTVKYNRSPAVAPLGVMKDPDTQERLDVTLETIQKHWAILKQHQTTFAAKVLEARARLDAERNQTQTALVRDELTVDGQLYDDFFDTHDKQLLRVIRAAQPVELEQLGASLHDARLQLLLPLYKARNFPSALTSEERAAWDAFCAKKLLHGGVDSRLAQYFSRLDELTKAPGLNDKKRYLLEELRLYGESIVPVDAAG